MNFFERKNCVICLENQLLPFKTFTGFPIKCIHDENDVDISWNLIIGRCEYCGSVQQLNMLNPSIMYGGKYPLDTTHSPMWKRHHESFASFITKNVPNHLPIIEIGSSSGILVEKLFNRYSDYTIFDFSLDSVIRKNTLKYIEGNCETYAFPQDCAIVMSHVLEHLFEPTRFLHNCSQNKVNTIIISIPTMEDTNRVHLTREHTFMYNHDDILYLFNKYGYHATSFQEDEFSLFYCFTLTANLVPHERKITPDRYLASQKYFNKTFEIPENSFLVGAGFWSQILYNSIVNKENVIGVLDNDSTKQGRQYFQTSFIIKPFVSLQAYSENTNVLVIKNKYWTNEIVDLIKKINKNINIFFIDYDT
jgi:hypothetical protein